VRRARQGYPGMDRVFMSKTIRLMLHDLPLHFVLLLTNWLPDNTVFLRLRGALAAPWFGECGRNLRLGRNLTFYNPSRMHFGSDIYVAQGCWFMAAADIIIGSEVLFGPYCVVVTANHTRRNRSFRFGSPAAAPVHVASGTWLGGHVTVTAGSSIGAGTVVAANSVVVGEIPDDVLAAGAPATVQKTLT
jgi:acetyltransferase-like isoleucine patch superfamily enzyme